MFARNIATGRQAHVRNPPSHLQAEVSMKLFDSDVHCQSRKATGTPNLLAAAYYTGNSSALCPAWRHPHTHSILEDKLQRKLHCSLRLNCQAALATPGFRERTKGRGTQSHASSEKLMGGIREVVHI